jgi:hypothetical protein
MWTCSKCGEEVQEDFEVCWSCGTTRDGIESPAFDPKLEGVMGDKAYQAQQATQKDEDFITVATFGNAPEAHMARSRLEAEGIHGYLMNEMSATAIWGLMNAPDGVQLQVAEKDADRARDVLAELRPADGAKPEGEKSEDQDEEDEEPGESEKVKPV